MSQDKIIRAKAVKLTAIQVAVLSALSGGPAVSAPIYDAASNTLVLDSVR